jgi:hypothetical protein
VTDLFSFPEILIAFIFMGGHGGPARPVAETAAAVAVGCGEAPVSSGNRRARATERTRSGASYSGECDVLGQLALRQLISTESPLERSMNALNKLKFLRMIWNANYPHSLAQPITVW